MKQIGIVCLLLLVVFGQAIAENYQKIRIYLSTSEDIQKIADLGIDFEGSYYKRDQFIDLQISRFEKDILENSGFITEVLISDLEEFYRSRLETRTGEGFGYGSMGGYYTYSEVMADLDSLIATYPNLVSQKQIIGYSVLGKPLVAVRISDNPNIQENEPEVLYTGLHHAREPMSMMVLQYFMWYLVENYGSDPQATFLVDNRQMWFIPVVNPDGYVYNEQTNPNGGGMWRLNARDNNDNGSHFQSGIDGVDLNRNYGYQWGYDNSGSSPTPGSQTYRGPGPFSEVETAFVRDFCNQHQYITALNYHTYSNLLIHPWAYNDSPTPDHQYFYTFGMDMTRFNGYVLGTPSQTVGYAVNGDANDWMYGEQTSKPKIFAYTPEVGSSSDNFWPPTNRILPLAQENLYPNIVLSYIAGSFPKIVRNSIRPYGQNRYADPGEMIKIYPEITNYGLKPTGPVGIELVSRQPSITVLQNSIQFPGMQTFDSLAAGIPWKFQVPYTTVPGTSLVFDLQIFDNGTLVNTDSLIMTVGTFDIAFADSGNTALTRWSAGGSNGSWGMTSTSSHSPVYSFTDSPVGDYANSCDFWLRSESVNLSDATSARLHYWTKWDIEAGWDFGLVELSTNNGISWTSVKGNYMKPASGSGVQTPGLFGYDGVQNEWVQESIDLQSYCGQNIMIRFRMKSDGYVTGDGWYVDDILIEKMSVNTNIPPYISQATDLGYQIFNGQSYPVSATILDDYGIQQASLFYSTDGGNSFTEIPMIDSDSLYEASIPALSPGLTVTYYVQAWDSSGSCGFYPYEVPDQTMSLIISGSGPLLVVEPADISFSLAQLSSGYQDLKILNPGTDLVTFQILDTTVTTLDNLLMSTESSVHLGSYLTDMLTHRIQKQLLPKISRDFNNKQPQSFPEAGELSPTIIITDPSGDVNLPGVDILSVDISETAFNYNVTVALSAPPDTNSIAVLSIDLDQNFGTGVYPAPSGYGLGNSDIGSEYEIYFDFANFIGDSLGISEDPLGYVVDVRDSTIALVGLPVPIQYSGPSATISLSKFLYPVFDGGMNLSAMMVQLSGASLPDLAPDLGHGNLGGELGCSWITEMDSTNQSFYPLSGTINAGDSAMIRVKAAAALPQGSYQAKLIINNSGPVTPVEVPISMLVSGPGNPVLSLEPSSISDTLEVGSGIYSIPLTISNTGNATLYFTIADSVYSGQDWLNASPQLGVVSSGEYSIVQVEIDRDFLLNPGIYQAELQIISNDPSQPQSIVPIRIQVESANSIVTDDPIPATLKLNANFPNPFNPTTTISFDLPRGMQVKLEIFNLLGQNVATLVDNNLPAGSYDFSWDTSKSGKSMISSGIYFYRLETPEGTMVKKMLLAK